MARAATRGATASPFGSQEGAFRINRFTIQSKRAQGRDVCLSHTTYRAIAELVHVGKPLPVKRPLPVEKPVPRWEATPR